MKEKEVKKKLENYTTIGKKVNFRPRREGQKGLIGKVEKEVSVVLDNGDKHFIQKIKTNGGYHYRFCYYTLDNEETKIVFGQFSSTMPEEKFKKLIKKAIKKFFSIEEIEKLITSLKNKSK